MRKVIVSIGISAIGGGLCAVVIALAAVKMAEMDLLALAGHAVNGWNYVWIIVAAVGACVPVVVGTAYLLAVIHRAPPLRR